MLMSVHPVRFLKNINILCIIVTLMQTAPIPEDRSTAHVTQGILETELHVLVNLHVLILSLYQ